MKSDTGPFSITPEWVLDAGISDRACRLYAVLGRYADAEGECWPSRRTLATRLACSDDSIDRAKNELIAIGALECEPQIKEGLGQTSNLYTLKRAAPLRLPLRNGDPTPLRTAAAQNESHLEREPSLAPTASARKRDEIFDKLCDVAGIDPDQLTRSGRGSLNAAIKELRTLGVTPDEIATRARSFARKYPNAVLTAPALVKHWGSLGNGRTSRSTPAMTPEQAQAEFARLMEEDPL